ncbi:MAG: SGNH/GDSL hydrolase family protein [Saprospiraceae bacterium]
MNFPKLLILLPFFLFQNCDNKEDLKPIAELPTTTQDTPFHSYLALGDSYTIGQGVSPEERWPNQLQAALATDSIYIDTLSIIAQTGWTTANLIDNIASQNPPPQDIVSLLIGVNDQFQNKPYEVFTDGFDELLQTAIDLAGSSDNVFVVSIPDYGVTPFGSNNSATIAMELDEYNAYMEGECEGLDIPFINITEISRALEGDENALASDNLHPSGYQYGLWVEEMFAEVKVLLGE